MKPMEHIARWVANHPKRTIIAVFLLTMVFLAFSLQVQKDTRIDNLFPNYPEVETLNAINEDFGNQEFAVVIIRGNDVLTPEYFQKTADITEKLLADKTVSSALIEPKQESITSLPWVLSAYRLSLQGNVNPSAEEVLGEMRSFRSKDEILKTLDSFLNDPHVPGVMKGYALALLPKSFNVSDGKSGEMVIYISLNGNLPSNQLQDAELGIEKIAKNVDPGTLTYGFELLNYYYVKTEEKLIPAFLLALALILTLMAINFRRLSDIAISLGALFIAMVWTFGLAGILGWKLDLVAGMVPILILGLGIDFSFHVLMEYRERFESGEAPKSAVILVISTVGVALFLAMITTVVGFLSNGISEIPSMRHFGVLSAFSIFAVFLLNLTLVPALRELLDTRKPGRRKSKEQKGMKKNASFHLPGITRRSCAAILLLLIFGISIPGWVTGMSMKASYDPTGELAKDAEITKAYEILNENFDVGTETVFIRIDGDLTDTLLWWEVQRAVENMNDDSYVVKYNGTARVDWILTAIPMLSLENPEVARLWMGIDRNMDGRIDRDASPEALKAFLEAVYSTPMGRHYIHRNENGNFDGLLIRVATRTKLGYHGEELVKELEEDFSQVKGSGIGVRFTGMPIIWARGINDIRDSMVKSILLCLAFAFTILPVAFGIYHRSPLLGILTALSPVAVMGWLFMTMKLLGIPLNMMTAMVGAIIVGLGIDYPIHMANRWALERKAGKTPEECYTIALSSTGREVFYSALTTLVAFGVFIIIPIPVIAQFALTVFLGLIYSLLGAVVVLPLLLRTFWHR